jgi:hemerythrin-like domain-containing protein
MLGQDAGLEGITQNMQQDHHRIDGIAADLGAMIEDGEMERADYAFADLDEGLRRHIRIEEELLFPVIEAKTGMLGPTRVMRIEHQRIAARLDELKEALRLLQRPQASAALMELLHLLGAHNLKEEQVLYPRTDAALSPPEIQALLGRISRFP